MPHYYFHVTNSTGFVKDEEGRELSSIEAARREGVSDIRSILSEEVKLGRLDLRGHIEITNEEGTVVSLLPFEDAIKLSLQPAPDHRYRRFR
jgi:hypothetical protein